MARARKKGNYPLRRSAQWRDTCIPEYSDLRQPWHEEGKGLEAYDASECSFLWLLMERSQSGATGRVPTG